MSDEEVLALLDRILNGDRPEEKFGEWIEMLVERLGAQMCTISSNVERPRTRPNQFFARPATSQGKARLTGLDTQSIGNLVALRSRTRPVVFSADEPDALE